MRWDLIDRFELLQRGRKSRACKSFSGNEDFFSEHFPASPRVPEPLLIEMVAQAGGVLYGMGLDFAKEVILAKVDHARFFVPIEPPCELTVETHIAEEREEGAWIEGEVLWKNKTVAEVRLFLIAIEGLEGGLQKVVFNDKLLAHYDVFAVANRSEGVS